MNVSEMYHIPDHWQNECVQLLVLTGKDTIIKILKLTMTLAQDQSIIDVVTTIARRRVVGRRHHLHPVIEKGNKSADPMKKVYDPTPIDISLIGNMMNTIVCTMNEDLIQDRPDQVMNDLLMNL